MTATTDQPQTTDRIEKRFEVSAKRSRVWRAISDANEFGAWFGMKLDRPFTAGATVFGRLTIAGYEHISLESRSSGSNPRATSLTAGIPTR